MEGRTTYSNEQGFPQQTGITQRFSMALIFGMNTDDLFTRKKTVQSIYNASYQFAKPPAKPIVKAIAGDKKVTLYWDSGAELTYDAFYQKYSFEGYRVYRSTEPNFIEDQVITDAFGNATYRTPIAQFDLVDGITGLFPITVNGASFYLGDDSGLQHSFVDTTVVNGQTYYYAVCSYDQGYITTNVNGVVQGIPPSECTSIIKVDANGKVTTDVNTAVVTPTAPSAGYISPQISNYTHNGPGSGTASITILDPDSLKNNNVYRINFKDSTQFHTNPFPYFNIINYTDNDTLVKLTQFNTNTIQTLVIDGISVGLTNDTLISIDVANSGWLKGSSNYLVEPGFDSRFSAAYAGQRVNFPADFQIQFTAPGKGDTSYPADAFSQPIISNIIVSDLTDNIPHVQFIFEDENKNGLFDAGDAIFVIAGDSLGGKVKSNANRHVGWSVSLFQDTTIPASKQLAPQTGDIYKFATFKPFRTGEYYQFTMKSAYFDKTKFKLDMADVAVVPNPYCGAASWEPASTQVGRANVWSILFICLLIVL